MNDILGLQDNVNADAERYESMAFFFCLVSVSGENREEMGQLLLLTVNF